MDAKNLADLYELPTMDWAPIEAQLNDGFTQAPGTGGPNRHSSWLATINRDGSPHVTAVGALWIDGAYWFTSNLNARKARNIKRDPRCSMSVSALEFDLTVEGEAHLVTDTAAVQKVCDVLVEDWPCRVDDSGTALTAEYSAPSAGPAPWHVFRITPRSAVALATVEPGGATRWTF